MQKLLLVVLTLCVALSPVTPPPLILAQAERSECSGDRMAWAVASEGTKSDHDIKSGKISKAASNSNKILSGNTATKNKNDPASTVVKTDNNRRIAIIGKNTAAIKKLNSRGAGSARQDHHGKIVVGVASFYAHSFHDRQTASGIVFDSNAMTAASNDIAIPSVVKVTNMKTNKSIHVLVNDKGPFAENRIIDLSKRAASELGFVHHGISKVKIEYSEELTNKLLNDKQEYASYGIAIAG